MILSRSNAEKELLHAAPLAQIEFDKQAAMPSDFGITGSTFRAFRNCKVSPSSIYRSWVKSEGYDITKSNGIDCRENFINLHRTLEKSLNAFWEKSGARPLSLSERNKVIDLFTKAVSFYAGHPCEHQRLSLYKYANIPLDKFSLLAVQKLFYGIVICDNPSMGHIRDEETYNFIQSQIFKLTSETKISNLVFDHYSWNMTH